VIIFVFTCLVEEFGILRYALADSGENATMKSIADLILDLQHADGPDRNLDIAISEIMGYERQVKVDKPSKKQKVVWLYSVSGEESSNLPYFTAKIDAAKLLALALVPGCTGGFSWNQRNATARINDGPIFSAATPAIAICVAALSAKHFNMDEKILHAIQDDDF
jgi:hypothetical protein